jgi:hypothetical protein
MTTPRKKPPNVPSQVFLGETSGESLVRPKAIPVK